MYVADVMMISLQVKCVIFTSHFPVCKHTAIIGSPYECPRGGGGGGILWFSRHYAAAAASADISL